MWMKLKDMISGFGILNERRTNILIEKNLRDKKTTWLIPFSEFEMSIVRASNPGKELGRLTLGDYPTITKTSLLAGQAVAVCIHPSTTSAATKFKGDMDGDFAVSPYFEDDTITFRNDATSGSNQVGGLVHASKKGVSQILDACLMYGAIPFYMEPFWLNISRGIAPNPEGEIYALVMNDGTHFCAFANGFPVIQSSSSSQNMDHYMWAIKGVVQGLRNAGINKEKQEIFLLSGGVSDVGNIRTALEQKTGWKVSIAHMHDRLNLVN